MDKKPIRAPRLGKDKLTLRERGLIKALASGKGMTEAALEAGYPGSPNTARVEAHRAMKRPNVVEALERALDDAGATIDTHARVVAEAQKAERVTYISRPDGVMEKRDPDHDVRLKAANTAAKWRGSQDQEDGGKTVLGIGFFILKGLQERGLPVPEVPPSE